MKKFLLSVVFVLVGITASAQVQMSPGQAEFIFNANAIAAPQTGTVYSIPSQINLLTWNITFASAPASHSTILETSNDNSVWATADTSTNVNGESRSLITAAKFVRATESARSGGGAITITIIGKGSAITAMSSSTLVGTTTLASGQFLAPVGTVISPSYSYTGDTGTGLFRTFSGMLGIANAGSENIILASGANGGVRLGSSTPITWNSAADPFSPAPDTGISRTAPGILFVGNGTAGDSTGLLQALTLRAGANISTSTNGSFSWNAETKSRISSTTDGIMNMSNVAATIGSTVKVDALPTVFSGFGTSPSVTTGSTAFAGQVNIGTGGVATGGIIAFNGTAFPSVPFCVVTNATATTVTIMTAASTTTQLTINADRVIPASSLINWQCVSAK